MARLTATQLVVLSAALQREDRGVELPANVQGKAAGKVVDKLIRAGLLSVGPNLRRIFKFKPFNRVLAVRVRHANGVRLSPIGLVWTRLDATIPSAV